VSSIHEALRKAERDRETRLSVNDHPLVSYGSRRFKGRRAWAAAGVFVAAVCVVPAIYSSFKPGPSVESVTEITGYPEDSASAGKALALRADSSRFQPASPAEDLKLFRMACVLQQAGKLEEAGALYEEICRLNPRFIEAKNNLGVVYLALEDYISAKNAFLDVIAMNPDYPDAHYNLACVYAASGRNEEALAALSRAIDLEPEACRWALKDKDLAALRHTPEFERIIPFAE